MSKPVHRRWPRRRLILVITVLVALLYVVLLHWFLSGKGLHRPTRSLLPASVEPPTTIGAQSSPPPGTTEEKTYEKSSLGSATKCRWFIEKGKRAVDDRGQECEPRVLQNISGCCPSSSIVSDVHHRCGGCLSSKCCATHTRCVSCCLHPVNSGALDQGTFDRCVGKCRHDKSNTVHQNRYAAREHHCF